MSGTRILDADMQTVRGWIVEGWGWWIDQLQAMVPETWRRGSARRLATASYHPARGVIDAAQGPGAALAVVLPDDLALVRTIALPALSRREIAALVELDAERLLPLARADMVLATRIDGAAGDDKSGRVAVQLAALPRAAAERLADALAALDRAPDRVVCGGADDPAHAVDLLPALRRAGLAGRADRAAAPLWLVVGFLFALNVALLVWRDVAARDALQQAVDQQQAGVNVARGITGRMAREDKVIAAAVEARRAREPLALLARIDAALPPGTWLQRFTWGTATIQLAGFHPPKTDVAGALRKAGLQVARYGDTANAGTTPLGEPFEITLRTGKR